MNAISQPDARPAAAIPELPERKEPARRIRDDAEALAIARELAAEFAEGAAARDRERRLPVAEVERFSQTGLWAISVPKAFGGAGASSATIAEVTAIVAAADGSLGQIPQNHFYMVEAIRLDASEAQQRFYFDRALQGDRFGNALSEIGGKFPSDYETTVLPAGDAFVLSGRKFYSTGALFAHWIAAVANNRDGKRVIAFVPRGAPGLTLLDDWTGFGQRTSGSGTTIFDNVELGSFALVEHYRAFERPTAMGAFAQIIHAAVDLGIARGAYLDALGLVRRQARAFVDSGVERAFEDPYTIAAVGDLRVRLTAAEALVERAAEILDRARADAQEKSCEEASIAVAEARVATTEASLLITAKLFELGGSSSTSADLDLDRYWRDARTHTLHDPVRWKYHAIGNYWLNGVAPPRRGTI
jgi:SfnB family sulfur acquisition oxidoreductase